MNTETLKYSQIFERNAILSAIPSLEYPELSSRIVLAKVAYANKVEEYNKFMNEDVVKKLKPEGFDEQTEAIQKMKDVEERMTWTEPTERYKEMPELPTKEELDKAEETRKIEKEYNETLDRINEDYRKASAEKMEEEITMKDYRFTTEEFNYFSKVTSEVDKNRVYNIGQIKAVTEHFLMIIGGNFVNEEY